MYIFNFFLFFPAAFLSYSVYVTALIFCSLIQKQFEYSARFKKGKFSLDLKVFLSEKLIKHPSY